MILDKFKEILKKQQIKKAKNKNRVVFKVKINNNFRMIK
jgi:hypothetical protein